MSEAVKNQSFDEYRADKGLNASAIVRGRKSMMHMLHEVERESDTETPLMRWGRLIHAVVLEPAVYSQNVLTWDTKVKGQSKNSNKYKEFAAENDESWIVSPDEHAKLLRVGEIVTSHTDVEPLLDGAERELSAYWESSYGEAKCRFDAAHKERGILELKSTGNIEIRAFMSLSEKMGYWIKCGHYMSGAIAVGYCPSINVVCIEANEPHDLVVYHVPVEVLTQGYEECERIGKCYRACQKLGVYPGVAGGKIMQYERPAWAGGEDKVELVIGGEKTEV